MTNTYKLSLNQTFPDILSRTLTAVLLALILGLGLSQPAWAVDYSAYEEVLQTYVDEEGRVDYEGLLENRDQLDQFIKDQIEETDISSFSDSEEKAFWMNAYNALTLKLILDHYPPMFGQIRSINWGRPWSVKMRAAGKEITLGEIEHEILRKWDPIDPRIHFAINCASIGCPKLPNTHFAPEKLDQQLDFETRRFINDPEKVYVEDETLYHSAIFKWFKEDFIATHGSIKDYIRAYLNQDPGPIQELKTIKYDWGLNKQE